VTYRRSPAKAAFKPIQPANTMSSVDILFLARESTNLNV
jgi:hypothetical protein